MSDLDAVSCAICGVQIDVRVASYSIVAYMATTGPELQNHPGTWQPALECPVQHFSCSLEHARQAAIMCINAHLLPNYAGNRAYIEAMPLAEQAQT